MACSFNCLSYFTLIFQRSTGKATWKDFSLFVQEFFQKFRIFVIDVFNTALFETAIFFLFTSTDGGVRYLISPLFAAIF